LEWVENRAEFLISQKRLRDHAYTGHNGCVRACGGWGVGGVIYGFVNRPFGVLSLGEQEGRDDCCDGPLVCRHPVFRRPHGLPAIAAASGE
jgi:hypothetical protein